MSAGNVLTVSACRLLTVSACSLLTVFSKCAGSACLQCAPPEECDAGSSEPKGEQQVQLVAAPLERLQLRAAAQHLVHLSSALQLLQDLVMSRPATLFYSLF